MNGYLMQEKQWTPGEDLFIESFAPENRYGVVFEDDGESAYFYAVEKDGDGSGLRILDALHINQREVPEQSEGKERGSRGIEGNDRDEARDEASTKVTRNEGPTMFDGSVSARPLLIVWSKDWLKCALVIDGFAHALFDFDAQGGYNINEFPPPNEFWTKGDRKLTDELIKKFF